MPSEEGAGVPPQSKGSWSSFLKSIASFNGDLSSLTAPPFILSTTSLVEFSAYWTEHPDLFVAPAQEKDPGRRAALVLKWFLSTLKSQYASRSEKLGSEKKPLNPFLGELFLGQWEDQDDGQTGVTQLVSEQVSHHPPVTAYCIWNDKHGVRLQGYNAQKASFSRTINVRQVGHAVLSFTPPDSSTPETYLITLPALHIESLIYGTPFVELNKYTHIVSSTGYVAKIDYSGRGWLSGKKNSFTASLWKDGEDSDKHPLYTADGSWTESFSIKDKDKKEIEYHDVSHKPVPLTVAPIEKQDAWESRRAWANVARAIEKGDMDVVSYHKSIIENAQRELRKKEKSQGREWQRRFFTKIDQKEPVFEKLAQQITGVTGWAGIEEDKTGGIWRFDPEKAKEARPPFYESTEGLGLKDGESDGSAPTTRETTQSSTHSLK